MTHASLFSGIGGFDLAAEWAGWTNLFNCEINPFCQTVLKHHFPNATQYSDIKTTDFTVWRGRVDVLTGGFPCQPFSVAGKRKGTDDDRYLWPEMLRAIREISPRFVVGENVRGIINWSKGMVFEQVCADLEALGYEVQPFLIPAVAVDAPHRRDRVWFIAHAKSDGDCGRPEEILQENGRSIGQLYTKPVECGCIRTTAYAYNTRDNTSSNANIQDWAAVSAEREYPLNRARGFSEIGATADTDSTRGIQQWNGNAIQDQVGIYSDEKRHWFEQSAGVRGCGEVTSNTSRQQSQRMQLKQRETGEPRQGQFRGGNSENTATNTVSKCCKERTNRQSDKYCELPQFDRFPTQSPVCRGDDGISDWLDFDTVFAGIPKPKQAKAFPRWRSEAIKGYGNAVVPQIPYIFFQIINQQ